MTEEALLRIELPNLIPTKSGKVRDIFDFGDKLLIVTSDRISAFDVIMPNGVPDKGKILTQISLFWFDYLKDIIENHIISTDIKDFPGAAKNQKIFEKRSMLVHKAKVLPIECVVRGYISGSGWKEYKSQGTVCSIKLPAGLSESEKLPEPIFTPTTKEETGHDMAVTFEAVVKKICRDITETIREKSIALYTKAADYADKKGIIIADTKFEFGIFNNKVIIIDEALTPDSSRFWPKDQHKVGISPPSFDKQYLRDYLETLDWNKTPPGPNLPKEVIMKTREKYLDAYKRLTGKEAL